jgi:hypothetical protein
VFTNVKKKDVQESRTSPPETKCKTSAGQKECRVIVVPKPWNYVPPTESLKPGKQEETSELVLSREPFGWSAANGKCLMKI